MEYMNVKGGVELRPDYQLDRLKDDILTALANVSFMNEEGIVLSKIKNDRLWILGEGLMRETEANKFIGIVKRVYGYSDKTCCIDVQRIRWELNIIIGNNRGQPDPIDNEMLLEEAS